MTTIEMRKNNLNEPTLSYVDPMPWTKKWLASRIDEIFLTPRIGDSSIERELIKSAIWWEMFTLTQCWENYYYLTGQDLYEVLYTTLISKNSDYSSWDFAFSNLCLCESIGISAEDWIRVRMCDKVSRIRNLLATQKEPDVVSEKLCDTWLDLAWYLVLYYLYNEYCALIWHLSSQTVTNKNR